MVTEGVLSLLRRRLEVRPGVRLQAAHARAAAVLVPLYPREGGLNVVLTRRTEQVEYHKGQISFPGGTRDPADAGPVETALRESQEEIGLAPGHVEILGTLDDYVTGTGFCITPVVGAIRVSPYPFRPNAQEVAEIIQVPLAWLVEPGHMQTRYLQRGGEMRVDYCWEYGGHLIWGATGGILKAFIDVLRGEGHGGPGVEPRPRAKGLPG